MDEQDEVDKAWIRLIVATQRGNYGELKALLGICSSKINERTDDWYGYTALLYATMCGHESCVKLLLDFGADPAISDSQCNQTPILLAARYGQFHLIPLLIDYQSPIDRPDDYGQTALQWAAWKTHVDSLQVLRMGGESILDGTVGYFRFKSLVWAADDVDMESVLYLIKHGANIFFQDYFSGDTVLARCNEVNQGIIVSYTKKLWLETAIHRCIYENDQKQLSKLLRGEANESEVDLFEREEDRYTFDGWLAVHLAVYLNRVESVKLIIENDYNAKYAVTRGERFTAFHIAAQRGFFDIIELLAIGEKVEFVYNHNL